MKKLANIFIALFITSLFLLTANSKAFASTFDSSRLIDDSLFTNTNSMTVAEIQQFLDERGGFLATWQDTADHYADFIYHNNSDPNGPTTTIHCKVHTATNKTAAQIIYEASTDWQAQYMAGKTYNALGEITSCGAPSAYPDTNLNTVNPKVLLITLQKEQTLLTATGTYSTNTADYDKPCNVDEVNNSYGGDYDACWNNDNEYKLAWAMGYGVPDSGSKNHRYKGLYMQINYAAWQLRFNYEHAGSCTYTACVNDVSDWDGVASWYYAGPMIEGQARRSSSSSLVNYDGYSTIDGSSLYIDNRATASLYYYTPHTYPGYYGNYNFVLFYEQWFGSPVVLYNIVPVTYDINTDTTGETAKIGFKLTSKPNRNVIFDITYSTSNFSSGETQVKITPSNWDRPEKNIVILKGRYNPNLHGGETLYLNTGSLRSDDPNFNLSSPYTPDVPILHQDQSTEVFRLYEETIRTHLFTSSVSERDSLVADGWRDEGVGFNSCKAGDVVYARLKKDSDYKIAQYNSATFHSLISSGYTFESLVASGSTKGSHILYQRYNETNNATLYTLDSSEGNATGYSTSGTLPVCPSNTEPIYRLYSSSAKDHFYTKSSDERNSAREKSGYSYEGVGFYVSTPGDTPVYRLYSSENKNHFYTTSVTERDSAIVNYGYRNEGTTFNTSSSDIRSVFRLYNGDVKNHFYTTSESEKDGAVLNFSYRYEGAAFNAY